MNGIWNAVKSILGITPASPRAPGHPTRTDASPAPVVSPPSARTQDATEGVFVQDIFPSPCPGLEGVINGHRHAVGNRTRRLMASPPAAAQMHLGILNASRHCWRTRQSGVLNAERHQWKPPFPEIINSDRHQWKPWLLSGGVDPR